MAYKVLYHVGESVTVKTKCATGRLSTEDRRVSIRGSLDVSIPFGSLRSVELFRMHGLGRMLKIEHGTGTLFVSVIRFNLFGLVAVVNFFGTGRLQKELQDVIRENGAGPNVNLPATNPKTPLGPIPTDPAAR